MFQKATIDEMKEEAMKRLELLQVKKYILDEYPKAFEEIPVTYFNAEVGEMRDIHRKVMKKFRENISDGLPFYITESWHAWDVISVLYVSPDKKRWDLERDLIQEGYHSIFTYILQTGDVEIGDGVFSIEDGILWRVY